MSIILRDKRIIYALGRYGVLDRKRISWLCLAAVPAKSRDRVARRRLAALMRAGYIVRLTADIPGTITPVYRLTKKGREWLEADSCDPTVLATPTELSQIQHVRHHLAVVDTHIMVRQASLVDPDLSIVRWINEGETVNYQEEDPNKRFTLFTVLTESPRLICSTDSAFHFTHRGRHGVALLEQDRASSSALNVIKHKAKGIAELFESKRNRAFFPDANAKGFVTLLITTKAARRDRLCDELAREGRPRPELWRVAALEDLNPETIFHAPVWRTHEKQPISLLHRNSDGPSIKLDSVRPPAPMAPVGLAVS